MGRETTRREMNYREAALEVWDLEFTHGTTSAKNAMLACVNAAYETAHRAFIIDMREALLSAAEELDADENNEINDDGPAAYIAFAMHLDDLLPPELQKGY